jgi:hypothetical protein
MSWERPITRNKKKNLKPMHKDLKNIVRDKIKKQIELQMKNTNHLHIYIIYSERNFVPTECATTLLIFFFFTVCRNLYTNLVVWRSRSIKSGLFRKFCTKWLLLFTNFLATEPHQGFLAHSSSPNVFFFLFSSSPNQLDGFNSEFNYTAVF